MDKFEALDIVQDCSFCNLFISISNFLHQQLEDHSKKEHSIESNKDRVREHEDLTYKDVDTIKTSISNNSDYIMSQIINIQDNIVETDQRGIDSKTYIEKRQNKMEQSTTKDLINIDHIKSEKVINDQESLNDYDMPKLIVKSLPDIQSINITNNVLDNNLRDALESKSEKEDSTSEDGPHLTVITFSSDAGLENEPLSKDSLSSHPVSNIGKKILKRKSSQNSSKLLNCAKCKFSTPLLSGLKKHIEKIHNKRIDDPYQCPNCEKKFKQKGYVKIHLKDCTEKSVTYIKKSSIFSLSIIESHLKRDLSSIEKGEFSKLIEEGRDMDIYIKIWGHWHHTRTWKCASCSHEMMGKLPLYDQHFKQVHGIRPSYRCEICSKIVQGGGFRSRKKFVTHLKKHLMEYLCTANDSDARCAFSTSDKLELNKHLEKVHDIKSGYKCKECKKLFKTSTSLNTHRKNLHMAHQIVTCTICEKLFPREGNLRVHMKIQHQDSKKWPCEICGKESSSKGTLDHHIKTIHSEDRKFYSCDEPNCDHSFLSKNGLRAHKRSEHSKVKEHVCQVCGNEFTMISLLKRHLIVHQSETPFHCETCGKRFKIKNRLELHMSVHTGKKPYECGYCGKKIRNYSNIFHHLKVHRSKKQPLLREKEYFKVE